ncbi:MAG: glycosyltransferase family 2 protein [Anaerolineales bacterium]|nr:glycosyltransferase family 2 protein [Anaerolineales bacterium]
MNLAVIIVNWNVGDLLAACLRSVEADLAESQLEGQIWVVDNASTDGSVAMLRRDFPQVQLIASEKNLGFAGGNNAALRAIGFVDKPPSPERRGAGREVGLPEAVLLLNPDTEVQPGALLALYDFLKNNPRAGIAGASLVYGDGSFQHSAFAFPGLWQLAFDLLPLPGRLVESSLNGRYPRSAYASGRPFRVDHPLGAAMCVRREAIQQVGLLDERYRMYVEEVDWSKRIVAAGWAVFCVPAAQITHFSGQSTGQVRLSSFINLWASRYQFYRKYYNPLKVRLAGQIVHLGMRHKARLDVEAAQRGELSQSEVARRLSGYEQVINIWQGKIE